MVKCKTCSIVLSFSKLLVLNDFDFWRNTAWPRMTGESKNLDLNDSFNRCIPRLEMRSYKIEKKTHVIFITSYNTVKHVPCLALADSHHGTYLIYHILLHLLAKLAQATSIFANSTPRPVLKAWINATRTKNIREHRSLLHF